MASASSTLIPPGAPARRIVRNAAIIVVLALVLLIPAVANRMPVLFPDTIGYNRAGETALAALGRIAGVEQPVLAHSTAAKPRADGVSGARSPFYGVALALTNRVGGVWLSAFAQAVIAGTSLLLALRRFGLLHNGSGWIAGIGAGLAGLGFFAVTLVPDIFLGVAILATAILLTCRNLPRGERWFWIGALLASMLFHRAFAAATVAVIIAVLPWLRSRWLDRRGLVTAAACCGIAFCGHFAAGVVTRALLHQPMITPPFVLARMADSPVLTAYLDEACPVRQYFLCNYRQRLPMPPNAFLWYPGTAGIYHGMTIEQRIELGREANTIVLGAVAARPVAAAAEAIRLSVDQFFDAGMTDFAMRIQQTDTIDASIAPAMPAYFDSGIIRGDFGLAELSAWTRTVFAVALMGSLVGAAGLIVARRQGLQPDARLVAAGAIIVAALVANAVISATLSGVNDRYQGRVAWLMVFAAVMLCSHAWALLASSLRSRVTKATAAPI